MKEITLQITTHNRSEDLKFSLEKNKSLINDVRVHTLICVDGRDDDSYSFIANTYPNIQIIQNLKCLGYIANRNRMMTLTHTPYAISLDDDAHFLGNNSVDSILNYFNDNPICAVIAFRIYWGQEDISFMQCNESPSRVRGFVGCGHAWRISHWKQIKPYPEWFIFYGEEEFAGYKLFKKQLEVHYNPKIFIHHRVNINSRKKDNDYLTRNRRSISSGWYLCFMFVPFKHIPKYWIYSFYSQIRRKLMKGDIAIIWILMKAILDIILNFPKIISFSDRLSESQHKDYLKLVPTKIYWKNA
jgi:GT2 family glycosyltransferase